MNELLMETIMRTALSQQFGASIDMLENALLACPDTLWEEHLWIDAEGPDYGTFWDITYPRSSGLIYILRAAQEKNLLPLSRSRRALRMPFPNSPIAGMIYTPI
jgi:hypothetical protein